MQFGPWAGAGMAAGDARLARQLDAAGAPSLPAVEGLVALASTITAVQNGIAIDTVHLRPSLQCTLGSPDCRPGAMVACAILETTVL